MVWKCCLSTLDHAMECLRTKIPAQILQELPKRGPKPNPAKIYDSSKCQDLNPNISCWNKQTPHFYFIKWEMLQNYLESCFWSQCIPDSEFGDKLSFRLSLKRAKRMFREHLLSKHTHLSSRTFTQPDANHQPPTTGGKSRRHLSRWHQHSWVIETAIKAFPPVPICCVTLL